MLEWFQHTRKTHVQPLQVNHVDIPKDLLKPKDSADAPHERLYGKMYAAHNPSILRSQIETTIKHQSGGKNVRVNLDDMGPFVRFDIWDPTTTQKELKKIVADWHAHTIKT
ncbi:hypothetical protein HY994_03305 [Candidatus Micrarchaeota archaeon]|nr:hypothetical protein [Candidatus Micrarchaeota archaeon]